MKATVLLLLPFFCGLTTSAEAQGKFNVGDKVEVLIAGDANHGVVVGAYKDSGYGYGTYQVHLHGEKYCDKHTLDTRYNAQYVQPRFQPDSDAEFTVGSAAEVRRYDGSVYRGQIAGKDNNKYQVRYSRQGSQTSEWFHAYNIRNTGRAQSEKEPSRAKAPAAASWSGQIFGVGDRVVYDGLGFLVTKSRGTVIAVDPDKRLYTIRNEKDASLKYSYPCYQVLGPAAKIDNGFFVGKWEVQIGGATSTFTKNGDIYRRVSGGMGLPPLDIKADGTYSWRTLDQKVIRGKWKARTGAPGIVLLKALDGLDYTLYEKTEAFAPTGNSRDEIGLYHLPSGTGYYKAFRIGPNKSCVLVGRTFQE